MWFPYYIGKERSVEGNLGTTSLWPRQIKLMLRYLLMIFRLDFNSFYGSELEQLYAFGYNDVSG